MFFIDLIEDIQYTANPKEVTTGGCMKLFYEQMGNLKSILRHLPLPAENYYYHENAVANLLSLGRVCKQFRALFDSDIHDAFYIFNDDGSYVVFTKTKNNLYSLSLSGDDDQCHGTTSTAIEADVYSSLDQRRAEAVLSLQGRIGFPNSNDLTYAMEHNLVGGYQSSWRDIRNANKTRDGNTIK